MRAELRRKLRAEAANWRDLGLIDYTQAERLAERYDSGGSFLAGLLKWLGLFAVIQLAAAALTFVGMMARSELLGALLLAGASAGLWWSGVRLASDPRQRHPVSGAALVTAALAGAFGTLLLLASLSTSPDARTVGVTALVTAVAAIGTAYRYRLRWPLLLGLLFAFHGIGSWHSYGGHGAYFADIQEPRLMAPIALATVLLGLWHERSPEAGRLRRAAGFGHLYLIVGLVYCNASLWFLSLPRGELGWVLAFTAAAIGQIVAGARLHDSRLIGFGIVFLGIDLYTRFFETFWDELSLGLLLLLAGVLGIAAGYLVERHGHTRAGRTIQEERP